MRGHERCWKSLYQHNHEQKSERSDCRTCLTDHSSVSSYLPDRGTYKGTHCSGHWYQTSW